MLPMTSFRLHACVQRLLGDTGTDRQLIRFLFILSRGSGQLVTDLMESAYVRNRTVFAKRQHQAQERFFELRRQLEAFPLGQIFHEAIELRQGLETLRADLEAAGGAKGMTFVFSLQSDLEQFYTAFETYLRGREDEAFSALLADAGHLYEHLSAVRRVLEGICQSFGHGRPVAPGAARLTLHFAELPRYADLAGRLDALAVVYHEAAGLFGINTESAPLEIVKVETGGLWMCVDGAAPAIRLVTRLVERYAAFLYQRLRSGEEDTPPTERITASQSLINLADELSRGAAPRHSEERMRESAVVLRDAFTALLAGAAEVHVNGDLHRVEPDDETRFEAHGLALTG